MNKTRPSDGFARMSSLFFCASLLLLPSGCSSNLIDSAIGEARPGWARTWDRLLLPSAEDIRAAEDALLVRGAPAYGWKSADTRSNSGDNTGGADYRWKHPRLTVLLRDEDGHKILRLAALSRDPTLAATAQIGLARIGVGNGSVLYRLAQESGLAVPVRCAAIETLAGEGFHRQVRALTRQAPDDYHTKIHAEILRAAVSERSPRLAQWAEHGLFSHSPLVIRESVRALLSEGDVPEVVWELVTTSNRSRSSARAVAIEVLGESAAVDAVDELIKASGAEEYVVRLAALKALGQLNTTESLAPILKLVDDKQAALPDRHAALLALGLAGRYERLSEFVDHQAWQLREAVAKSLEHASSPIAIDIAEQLINDESASVSKAAVSSLAAWPIARSGPLLVLCGRLNATFRAKQMALRELARGLRTKNRLQGDETKEELDALVVQLQAQWEDQFGPMDEYWARVREAPIRSDEPQARVNVTALASREKWIRQKAVAALVRQARRRSLNVGDRRSLLRAVQQSDALDVWKSALESVGESAEAEDMVKLALDHPDDEIRAEGLRYLQQFADARFAPWVRRLLDDDSLIVRRAALRCAQTIPQHIPASIVRLHALADDPLERALAAVVVWRQSPETGKQILVRMSADTAASVRRAVAQAIGQNRIRELKDVLLGMLNDTQTVREAAAESLIHVVDDQVAVLSARQISPADRVEFWQRWQRQQRP